MLYNFAILKKKDNIADNNAGIADNNADIACNNVGHIGGQRQGQTGIPIANLHK